MWLCILTGRQFEDTFENAQWRKDKQMQPIWLCILLYISALRKHLKIHCGEKPNKCNQCDFAPSQAGHLRAHLKTHSLLKCLWEFSFSSISCQKLPFVAKSYDLLPKVMICCQTFSFVAQKHQNHGKPPKTSCTSFQHLYNPSCGCIVYSLLTANVSRAKHHPRSQSKTSPSWSGK